jgi:hypothetical protein
MKVPNNRKHLMKKLSLTLLVVLGIVTANYVYTEPANENSSSISAQSSDKSDAIIASAFANHESNLQVSGQGVVTRLLPDDTNGSRHQKFIIKLSSGQTLLIAHNIDLAPKISSLQKGDLVQFYGEYEWNEKGGVVHQTHRDPNGTHVGGWLEHKNQKYQ